MKFRFGIDLDDREKEALAGLIDAVRDGKAAFDAVPKGGQKLKEALDRFARTFGKDKPRRPPR